MYFSEADDANEALLLVIVALRSHGFLLTSPLIAGIHILSADGLEETAFSREVDAIDYLCEKRGSVVLWNSMLNRDLWLAVSEGGDPYRRPNLHWTTVSFSFAESTLIRDSLRGELSAIGRSVFVEVASTGRAEGGVLTTEYLTEEFELDGLARQAAELGVPLFGWLTYVPALVFDRRLRHFVQHTGGRISAYGSGVAIEYGHELWEVSDLEILAINRRWLTEAANNTST